MGPGTDLQHDGIDGTVPILLYKKGIRLEDPTKESMGLNWNSGRNLLNRSRLRKWDKYGTATSKPRNGNTRFLINGLSEDINKLRRLFQEIIHIYSPKAQVWK